MDTSPITCPRCFKTLAAGTDARFCPHCGLADVKAAAVDTAPIEITAGKRTFQVLDRIAIGSISTIYRCRFQSESKEVEGIFKVARDARSSDLIANEEQILRRLHNSRSNERFFPFLPDVEASLDYVAAFGEPPRRANILRMHPEIRSPDELYSLLEVKAAYPTGLNAADMAWIWRRLLTILGFVQSSGLVHGAVLPMHILIDPHDHKLVLIDWCCARPSPYEPSPLILDFAYERWYRRQITSHEATTPALDIGLAASCMIDLMGGDALQATLPRTVESAIHRYFQRCLSQPDRNFIALKLLEEFDQLIEALWGPRKFREFSMPRKRRT